MSINFDLSNSNQSRSFLINLRIKSSEKTLEFLDEYKGLQRFTGFPIVMGAKLISLSIHVSSFGEAVIKGFGNIFGSHFSENCKLKIGLKQLFLQATYRASCFILEFPALPLQIIIYSIFMFVFPKVCYESLKQEILKDTIRLARINQKQDVVNYK